MKKVIIEVKYLSGAIYQAKITRNTHIDRNGFDAQVRQNEHDEWSQFPAWFHMQGHTFIRLVPL